MMGWEFCPMVKRGDVVYRLPRPIRKCKIQESWDFEQFKVPLLDGDFLAGHSRDGIDIAIEGEIGKQDGELLLSEEAMFAEYEALRLALDVSSEDEQFSFSLFYDEVALVKRGYQRCSVVRFEVDLSDQNLYRYSLVIHAADPVIQTFGS